MDEIPAPAQAPRQPGRLARAGTFIRNQAVFTGKNLFLEGIRPRGTTLGKWGAATQLIASGYVLASESLKGSTYAQIVEKLKGSVFLDTIAQSLAKDGQGVNNLDAYALIGLMLPSIVNGVRKGASAKVGMLIVERERTPQRGPESGPAAEEDAPAESGTEPWRAVVPEEYEHMGPGLEESEGGSEAGLAAYRYTPTIGDRLKAYCTTLLEKIPKYIAATYAGTVMLKTDLYSLGAVLFTPSAAAAQQAVEALKDSFSSAIVGTVLGIYAIYQGITLYKAKGPQA